MKIKFTVLLLILCGIFIHAQSSFDSGPAAPTSNESSSHDLPLRRISLLSSGVAYFEHSGNINSASPSDISFSFDVNAVNDALMSLTLNDPSSVSPILRYTAANSLERSLQSLRINLSWNPGLGEILNSQRGEEIEVFAPHSIRGRIIGVEQRWNNFGQLSDEARLSLFTNGSIALITLSDIGSFRFIDENINNDLIRSLDLLMTAGNSSSRELILTLDGRGNRRVSVSYVIPMPVWKVSYRLDLSHNLPLIQGWAIIDNDSDMDWDNVELSLLTGRPVSFIQNLYPPYYLNRPFVPLSVPGFAEAVTHETADRTWNMVPQAESMPVPAARAMPEYMYAEQSLAMDRSTTTALAGGAAETAQSSIAGDQFEFTFRNPVTLPRRQSAMLPLLEGNLEAVRTLVFSGSAVQRGNTINPLISVELNNTAGMALPPGPITIYDSGTYAGDALLEFLPENEKRIISFGEDLSVSGSLSSSGSRFVTGVSISGGVMTINRRQTHEWTYTIRNSSDTDKRLIIEHPITFGASLAVPEQPYEQTSSLYRFLASLNARETLDYLVIEETPVWERITLSQQRPETLLSYSTNQEIPPNVRAVLSQAVELRRVIDQAETAQRDLETQYSRLAAEQDRFRRNLEVTGTQSPQGQEYLRRMADLDTDIDNLNSLLSNAIRETQTARRNYEEFLAQINI